MRMATTRCIPSPWKPQMNKNLGELLEDWVDSDRKKVSASTFENGEDLAIRAKFNKLIRMKKGKDYRELATTAWEINRILSAIEKRDLKLRFTTTGNATIVDNKGRLYDRLNDSFKGFLGTQDVVVED